VVCFNGEEKDRGDGVKRRYAILFSHRTKMLCCNPGLLNFHCFDPNRLIILLPRVIHLARELETGA
jgi:hypothetical protein